MIARKSSDENTANTDQALVERQWNELGIPLDKLLLVDEEKPSSIITEDEVGSLDESEVVRGFYPLLSNERKAIKALQERLTSKPAVAM